MVGLCWRRSVTLSVGLACFLGIPVIELNIPAVESRLS
jgi:hypothetical protein